MSGSILVPAVICNRHGSTVFCTADVPGDLAALVVERAGCPNGTRECACRPVVSIVAAVDGDGVERALTQSGRCVEVSGGQLLAGENLIPALERRCLYMALSTASAYALAPARLFCKVLGQRLGLSDTVRETIELALHEAVINGILHGNLEIGSDGRETMQGFQRFCETVAQRLQDDRFAGRCLEIFAGADGADIVVTVADSGPGYQVAAPQSPDPGAKSGRGLVMIGHFAKSTRVEDGGRRLCMRFAR